jgi:hypothetical protein
VRLPPIELLVLPRACTVGFVHAPAGSALLYAQRFLRSKAAVDLLDLETIDEFTGRCASNVFISTSICDLFAKRSKSLAQRLPTTSALDPGEGVGCFRQKWSNEVVTMPSTC